MRVIPTTDYTLLTNTEGVYIMNKRSKTIISLLLTMAMVFTMNTMVFAWVDVKGDFSVICDSEKGYDHAFARMGNNPYEDVVLTSFTNGYNELLSISTTDNNTKGLWVYNEGTIPASFNEAWHVIDIQGYDGHGEEFYINKNFFDISDAEIENLSLGELLNDEVDSEYYVPVPGLRVFARPFHKNPDGSYKLLTVSMDIVHDDYYKDNQTWIRITYTRKEESSEVVDSPVEDEIKKLYPKEITTSYGDYNLTLSMNDYVPYCKKKKEVVNNIRYLLEVRDSNGEICSGFTIKKISATKPKRGSTKITFNLKGSTKAEKKAAKKLKKALKKIVIKVSENQVGS